MIRTAQAKEKAAAAREVEVEARRAAREVHARRQATQQAGTDSGKAKGQTINDGAKTKQDAAKTMKDGARTKEKTKGQKGGSTGEATVDINRRESLNKARAEKQRREAAKEKKSKSGGSAASFWDL